MRLVVITLLFTEFKKVILNRLRIRITCVLFFSLLAFVNPAASQSVDKDTSLILPTVHVQSSKIRQSLVGSNSRVWQKDQLERRSGTNLGAFLSQEAGTYIKSYGLGSIATSSVRGGSAGHTLVLWNGLPLQSPMLGLLDLSLLPIASAESISFVKGGNGAMWGSGAIGGVIGMNNEADFSQTFSLKTNSQIGSFGYFQQQMHLGLGNEKIQAVLKFSHQQAHNEFKYFVADGLPERKQSNAEISQQYLSSNLFWKIGPQNSLAFHFWWQKTDREIPPTLVQNRSEAHQNDRTTRLMCTYKNIGNSGFWNIKTGFFDEHLDYYDDLTLLESLSRFRTYLAELNKQWQWEKNEILLGNLQSYTQAWAPGYQHGIPNEYKTAVFASWRFKDSKWTSQISVRQVLVDGDWLPVIPSLGFDWEISPFFLKGKVSRNYRLPTFNDRFWKPGGNPNLLPESGWSQELSLGCKLKKEQIEISASLGAFNRNIDNWILWSLQEGKAFWSANNITKVWSRGLESRLSINHAIKSVQFSWQVAYDWIRSTNQVALENPKMEKGEQLIYTPRHQASGSLSVQWKKLHFSYLHQYTGKASGISDELDAFQVGNIQLEYSRLSKQIKASLYLRLNNIWDSDFIIVERRPMPGIHFQCGLKLHLNNK